MIRFFDVVFSAAGLLIGSPLLGLLCVLVWIENSSPIFRQVRLGRHQQPFTLVKFRTMRLDTDNVPTHMVSASSVTPLGHFLRRTKLDELPQLWNVLLGDMSLVGPRPGLPSHNALTEARLHAGVFEVRPGITGLAQLKGIDMSAPEMLAAVDAQMLSKFTVTDYFRYIVATIIGGGRGDRVNQ